MTLNELLLRHNFIAKVPLKSTSGELSKAAKVKLMGMRIELSKIRKEFDDDAQEAVKGFKPEGFDELYQKEDKTETETKELEMLSQQVNDDYSAFLIEKGKEEIDFDKRFTEDEYMEIVDVMPGDDVDINGSKLPAADFLEVLFSLFVA